MSRLTFDIETDGLLRDLSKIHCIVAADLDTGEYFQFDPGQIDEGIKLLSEADVLVGHNIIGFDLEAIKLVYPDWSFKGKVYDTLILSRLLVTDILDRDFRSRHAGMPGNLYGRHSLESWGYRLGFRKSEFGKSLDGDWSTYSPEMLEYCLRDVQVSVKLAHVFMPKIESYEAAVDLEHEVAYRMAQQERIGFPFDVVRAQELELTLRTELNTLSEELRSTFTYVDGGLMTPKRPNKTRGYVEGASFCRLKDFNPTSRHHIAWVFQTHRGWQPTDFTAGGQPRIDEETLRLIGTEESLKFSRLMELQKHLGQLSEGKNAWLKKVTAQGRIHHSCSLATNTGRMAHNSPNLAQIPSAHEYRELFHAGQDRLQVGVDASGLELRCLSHYLHRFDRGLFQDQLLDGDIHQALADIYGTDRKSGKGVTYALIYGAGNTKLGQTAGAKKGKEVAKGKEIRAKIMEGLAGFKQLSDAVAERAESGVLTGLDGRPVRLQGKKHAALNYLLQSAGAIITKVWLVEAYKRLDAAGLDWYPLAYVHDEVQVSVVPDQADQAKQIIVDAMRDVQDLLKFRCPLDAEGDIGANWGDTH